MKHILYNLILSNLFFLLTAAYLGRVGQHRYGRHEAGCQGHGHWQGRQLSPPCQELLCALPASPGPGIVDPDGSGHCQHEGEYHIVLHLQASGHQWVARHVLVKSKLQKRGC